MIGMHKEDYDAPELVISNIEKVVRAEEEQINRMRGATKFVDDIATFAGTPSFLALQLVTLAAWLLWNSGIWPFLPIFDPYPFPLFDVVVAAEAVILTIMIVIKQNTMAVVADRRAHLNLQINLLTEREVTVILKMQRMMCEHLGLKPDDATNEFSQQVDVEKLVKIMGEKLDD
jgi:uncharacterized membrane protein